MQLMSTHAQTFISGTGALPIKQETRNAKYFYVKNGIVEQR